MNQGIGMLTAMNRDGERVNASDAERFCDKGDYYCPRCEKPVYAKKGRIVLITSHITPGPSPGVKHGNRKR